MTTIDPSTVATMQGRELDIALYIHLFNGEFCGLRSRPEYFKALAPQFSHESIGWSYLGDVVEAVRAKGWTVEIIENLSPDESDWLVRLTFCHGGQYSQRESGGDTMPLAFSRAALLACLTEPAK